MNDFYEAVANLLEELRCDTMERGYVIAPGDLKEAEAETELKRMRKKQKHYMPVQCPDIWRGFIHMRCAIRLRQDALRRA